MKVGALLGVGLVGALLACSESPGPPAHAEVEVSGLLTISGPCMIEYCGPKYKLWNQDFSSYVALRGPLAASCQERLIQVWGHWTRLTEEESGQPPGTELPVAIELEYVAVISTFPYHEHLVRDVHRYTRERYGCDVWWNKTFGWDYYEGRPEVWVRLTDMFSEHDPLPYLEVHYDCETGIPVREVNNLNGGSPCE